MNKGLLKKLIPAALVVGALAAVGGIAALSGPAPATAAPAAPVADASANAVGAAPAQSAGEARAKPYIGIVIAPAASESDDASGGSVIKVIPDSPADGSLMVGDVITAMDGVAVASPRDVVRIARASQPGAVIQFAVRRSGAAATVAVTVGAREAAPRHPRKSFATADNLVLSETRVLTDGGVETLRKAVGTIQTSNSDGNFTLLLRDGSETLSFAADGETKIVSDSAAASVSDLNETDITLVVERTDAAGARQVEFVAQGELSVASGASGGIAKTFGGDFGRRGFYEGGAWGRGDGDFFDGGFSLRRFFGGGAWDRDRWPFFGDDSADGEERRSYRRGHRGGGGHGDDGNRRRGGGNPA